MARQYPLLRAMMTRNELTQTDIARKMGRSATYVNLRMTGRKGWTIDEINELMTLLDIPKAEVQRVFFS